MKQRGQEFKLKEVQKATVEGTEHQESRDWVLSWFWPNQHCSPRSHLISLQVSNIAAKRRWGRGLKTICLLFYHQVDLRVIKCSHEQGISMETRDWIL